MKMFDFDLWNLAGSLFEYLPHFFLTAAIVVVVPAWFGREIGIRKAYIRVLMKLFNWASRRIDREGDRKPLASASDGIIEPENKISSLRSLNNLLEKGRKFQLEDIIFLVKSGIEAVIEDEVTKRFRAEELSSWNLLTRSNYQYQYISMRLSMMWIFGLILRYCFLFPLRVAMTICGLLWITITMLPLAVMPDSSLKRKIAYFTNLVAFRVCCRALSAVVTYHDEQYMPKPGGICVANHTTTLDVCVLMQHRPYAILGQIHGGFLGLFERTLSKCTNHVWFERSEVRDRQFVVKRVREHLDDLNNYPILLFPEGTCINNTSVMMFKKGTFEIPATIHPVAIKYNPWFGDAFWNSSKHSMLQYLAVVMSNWAIVADVWYLPAMEREPDEDALHFADRVKSVIARKGGLVDCEFDGQLKRMKVKASYREENQKIVSDMFMKSENFDENSEKQEEDETVSSNLSNEKILFNIDGAEIKKSSKENEDGLHERGPNDQSETTPAEESGRNDLRNDVPAS